jgi:hypothetical protein
MNIPWKRSILVMGLLVYFLGSVSAHAGLILNVDQTNKYFWFTGSAGPETVVGKAVSWKSVSNSGSGGSYSFIGDQQIAVTGNSYSSDPGFIPIVTTYDGAGSRLFVSLDVTSNNSGTSFAGTGTAGALSYAGWTAGAQASLESYIGQSLPSLQSPNFGDLQIQGASIPEPGTFALVSMGVVAGGIRMWRRRRQKA